MWTDAHRRTAERKGLRYPSDLSEAEWRLVEPLIPPAKRGGRKRSVNVREVLNGIFYVLSTGRKRHIMVDTLGLMLGIVVHPANVQDRDGAEALLRQTRRSFPFIEVIFADGGYQGPIMAAVTAKTGKWRLEIVKRNDISRFEVLPKRWIVERTLAWISHCRRLARDFERHVRTVVAFVYLAMIRLRLRRLTATRSA